MNQHCGCTTFCYGPRPGCVNTTGPMVLNKYRGAIPDDAISIMRPSIWGNPFIIGRDGTRSDVIAKYKDWIDSRPDLKVLARRELRGHDLVCCCAPQPCHGDVLIKIANSKDET